MASKPRILIITDVQNDFCPGGALAVKGGDEIVPVINSISGKFDRVVATQDWHPRDQVSFASNHPGKKPFDQVEAGGVLQTLWPDHCVQGTGGAAFHPALDTTCVDIVIRKGTNPVVDSYSAFLENDKKTKTGLDGCLASLGAGEVYFCGLATDYCVFYSAMDSVRFGLSTSVIIDACRGIDVPPGAVDRAVAEMRAAGIRIVKAGTL
ncbi:MAG: bifunctional nicotinamidase/pyrazinamidase [Spirochaetes bacterium]|nr:bifunctional nicotinamidase/pyrazinamidase [Spirochaetota bacterium]